ncbi:hypothetical protein F25303_9961 [Fusarium sp. NRRL 25303]|nr:hypothetical protein F25303_9961 [Fusarium sp. NRRL 25303]
MSVIHPFVEFEKDLDVRIAETGAKWNYKKDSLVSSLDEFYEKECLKEPSKFPKIALKVMQAFKKTAHSSLEDLLKWVYATQRSQDDESKRQLKDLVDSMEYHFQKYTLRIDTEQRQARQRLLETARSSPSNPASNPEQKPEKPVPKRRNSALNRVGSAGEAFEGAKVTERITPNWQPRSSRHSRRRQNAMRMERTLNGLNVNPAISRKRLPYNHPQTYGNPKGPARRISMTAPRSPTAIRPKKRYATKSLWQELDASELQSDEPDDVPDKIHAKPSFKQEPVAAQGYRLPRISEELLIDDALTLGQQLNEEFGATSSLADVEEDSDGGDTKVEQMAEEGDEQQKRDLEEKSQSGPDGTIMLSPYMAMRLWKTLLRNNERVDFAIARCENLEKHDINASSVNELIDTWVPAIKDHHHKFRFIKSFFADIARHVLEVDLPPNAARKWEAPSSSPMPGHSETSAGTLGSQCLSTAPPSGSRDSFVSSNDDHSGENAEMNASSETKHPVIPDSKIAASFRPGISREFSVRQQKIKKNRESVTRGPYLSPPPSAGTQYSTTPQSSPRDGDSPNKWQSSLKEEKTPQKDSDGEKEAVSEDKKGDGPAGDMSSNGTGESSDISEASQEATTPAPGNSDTGDDPDPDPTKGATADIAFSHSSTKASGIFQSLKMGLRDLMLLAKLLIRNQVSAWCIAIEFVYQLMSWSFHRFIRCRNVDNDGKVLKFPNPVPVYLWASGALLSWMFAGLGVVQLLTSSVTPLWASFTDVVGSAILATKTYKLTGG